MCEVFRGEPGTAGAENPTWDSPFQCETTRHQLDNDWDFSISVPTLAEASGRITPERRFSLTDGTFRTDLPLHGSGASEVAEGETTDFFAVLDKEDKPFYENQARTEFSYQIVYEGDETGMWVAGLATNFLGSVKFSPDARCAIYNSNPLEGGGHLDDQEPELSGNGFKCTARGKFVHGPGESDNRHYDASFLVGWAPQ